MNDKKVGYFERLDDYLVEIEIVFVMGTDFEDSGKYFVVIYLTLFVEFEEQEKLFF